MFCSVYDKLHGDVDVPKLFVIFLELININSCKHGYNKTIQHGGKSKIFQLVIWVVYKAYVPIRLFGKNYLA